MYKFFVVSMIPGHAFGHGFPVVTGSVVESSLEFVESGAV